MLDCKDVREKVASSDIVRNSIKETPSRESKNLQIMTLFQNARGDLLYAQLQLPKKAENVTFCPGNVRNLGTYHV